jgi:CCR4-NOT transcription complex subunit 1
MAFAKLVHFSSPIKSSLLHFGRRKHNEVFEKDILSVQAVADSSRQKMNVASILEEIGAQSSGTIELFRKTLHNISIKLDEEQIAGVIIVILPRPTVNSEVGKENQTQWNLEVVAEVLNQECRGLNWVTVVKCLDSPNLIIRCEADYQLLTRLFVRISGASLPVLGLLSGVWNNRPAYLAILTLSANSPRNIVDFSTLVSPEQLMSAEVPAPANLSWLCLPLYARFFDLAASGMPNEVLDILSKAAGSFPEYFLTSLAQVQDPTSGVRSELLRRLLPSFTGLHGSRPTSLSVMRKLFTANSDLLILLCRFALKKAKKVWEISNIDSLLKSLGPQIVRRLEDEGTVDEMLGYWCVKADRSEVNLEEKAMLVLDANPKNARVFVSFAKVHADSLRPRVMISDGILSFECFAVLLRAVQAFPTIVSIDEVRALATIFSQHQQNLQLHQHTFTSQVSQTQQNVGVEGGFSEAVINDGNSELARLPPGPDSEEIEALANSYFQKIYSSEIIINDVIVLLRQFKSSTEKREQEIFRCMIHNLFDEYRFFHKYPEKELQVTGRLFGALIQNQLVSSITLGIALRYVLEALRKDPELGEGNDKMFRFGRVALDQFRSRLGEWPQYCSHLIQISHLARHSSDLFQEAQKALNNPQHQSQPILLQMSSLLNNDVSNSQVQMSGLNNLQRQNAPGNTSFDVVSGVHFTNVNEIGNTMNQNSLGSIEHLSHQHQTSNLVTDTSVVSTVAKLPFPVTPPSSATASEFGKIEDIAPMVDFGNGSRVNEIARMCIVNIDVLNTIMPPESVRDQIHFIINNIAKSNIEIKTNEIREILKPDHFNWFANYLVVKRISTQPNLHPLYLSVLDALDLSALVKLVLDSAYHNVTKLLQSPNITTSSSERSLLRNLGVWLGQMTLAKNRPLLQKRINLKELLFWGFETGRLIAVCSFVAKIVEGVKDSRVFRPPNPWLMAILGIMRELYEIEDLKLNIKFEVQVLCKNINIKIEDIPKGNDLVRCRGPVKDQRNPDFNSKGSISTPSTVTTSPTVVNLQPSPKVTSLLSPAVSTFGATNQSSSNVLDDSKYSSNLSELIHVALQGLSGLVVVNASLHFFIANPSHRRLVHAAVDRGVREIIQSAVERSVNIAITSTKCLVVKDFATEPNEQNVQNGAHLMAASLAGSLALATSKEPLRISIGNHLRTLLVQVISDQPVIEQIVQVCSNDNVDMGAAMVEKVAMEKALRDIDDLLAAAYQTRKRFRDIGQQFIDTTVIQTSGKYPNELNDVLKPGIGGLTPEQMQVYEAFQRIKTSPSPNQQSPFTVNELSISSLDGKTFLPPSSLNTQLSISQGLEAYQHVLVRIDASLKNVQSQAQGREVTISMLGTDHDIPHLLRDVNSVTLRVQLSQRSETAMTFAEIIFNKLFDSISSPDALRLEVLVAVLESLREACGGVRLFSPDFIVWLGKYAVLVNNDEISRKMYRLILILLLRAKLLKSADVDVYFVMYIDGGRNLFWLELALSFIRQCLVEGLSSIYEFSNTFDTVTKMRPSNMVLKKQLQKWLADIKTLTAAQEEQKIASLSVAGGLSVLNTVNANIGGGRDIAVREHVTVLLDRWLRVWNSVNDQIFGQYLQLMHQYGVLKTEEAADRFFRFATEICTEACIKSSQGSFVDQQSTVLNYTVIDALSKLFLLLVRLADKEASDLNVRVNLLSRILNAIARSILDDHETKKVGKIVFDQRPYFRLFSNLSQDLGIPESKVDPSPAIFGLLTAYTQVYLALNPSTVPGFAYGWVQLISHRSFMPHLLLAKGQKGWPYMHRLLSALLLFLQPFLKTVQMIEPVKKLYKGTLRVLLVLLHDFPEFLCDFHLSLCDLIPLNCVQLRNLILSAFPRSMRLPDPFTPNLKVDVLTESSQSPRILTDYLAPINGIRTHLDSYMASKTPIELPSKLPSILTSATGVYNLSLITSLVVYIGSVAIQQFQVGKISLQSGSPAMDIYRHLVSGALDAEGRYIVLNTMANQLRYPNSHTNFFSFVMLNLFLDAGGTDDGGDFLQEQITRVLLERLIVHRPHPVCYII